MPARQVDSPQAANGSKDLAEGGLGCARPCIRLGHGQTTGGAGTFGFDLGLASPQSDDRCVRRRRLPANCFYFAVAEHFRRCALWIVPRFGFARHRFALEHISEAACHSGRPSETLPPRRLQNRASDTTPVPYCFLSRRSTPLRPLAPYRRQGQFRD
jgi:hypothetical protein